ncbi:protein NRT1/ PTR FAMILY 1.2-like [Impatiens glandulifera]|uniref:protein NRT1/ PTR FAMILY 1.2-like n=1 Tax=Impatiens glandulifera TaxID=253017 RepID=UPI001FB07D9A|nr:protein NRT1/ PTR FAMILY 1.2-like [Impatiens glandulifera]
MVNNMYEEKTEMKEAPLLEQGYNKKGGFRTIPFIIANETFERVASIGMSLNMITYLMNQYHFEMMSASNLLYCWSTATNLFPLIGAYFSDSFVTRYWMIAYGCIFSFLGTVILWLTTMIPQLRPPPCVDSSNNCISPTTFHFMFLCSSFLFMSIGAGGIRSASMAFGLDQLQDNAQSLNRKGAMETYINWYSATSTLSVVIAMTFIVYIQDNLGWKIGFGVPLVLMFLSAISFFLASSLYVKSKPNSSLITGFIQVIVASFKKRNFPLPSNEKDLLYHHDINSILVVPSEKIRFLNKSCMMEDRNEDLTPKGSASNPWSLCSVDQVEALKKLMMLIPLWSTGILLSVNFSQPSFPVLQAGSMDRYITQNFQIPAATFSIFTIISLVSWLLVYDRILIPFASYILGRPARLNPITRMGLGIFLSFLSMVVAAYVEGVRRSVAIREGLVDNPKGMVPMSVFWLVPQYMLMGVAEALNMVAQTELYICELPKGLASIATNLSTISIGLGGVLASFIMTSIDGITKRGGNESWVSSNINKGHYDYYHWVLAGLSLVNVFYFMVCSRHYYASTRMKSKR